MLSWGLTHLRAPLHHSQSSPAPLNSPHRHHYRARTRIKNLYSVHRTEHRNTGLRTMTATASGSRMALTIDTQDEGVRIAAAALKDMREGNPPADSTNTVLASFAASRHERSHPSHSPTRREYLLVLFFAYLQLKPNFPHFYFIKSHSLLRRPCFLSLHLRLQTPLIPPSLSVSTDPRHPTASTASPQAHRFDQHQIRLRPSFTPQHHRRTFTCAACRL